MKELIDALHVIQDECKKHDNSKCKECPLYKEKQESCAVTYCIPYAWEINDKAQRALL